MPTATSIVWHEVRVGQDLEVACPFCGNPWSEGREECELSRGRRFCPRCGGELLEEVQDDA